MIKTILAMIMAGLMLITVFSVCFTVSAASESQSNSETPIQGSETTVEVKGVDDLKVGDILFCDIRPALVNLMKQTGRPVPTEGFANDHVAMYIGKNKIGIPHFIEACAYKWKYYEEYQEYAWEGVVISPLWKIKLWATNIGYASVKTEKYANSDKTAQDIRNSAVEWAKNWLGYPYGGRKYTNISYDNCWTCALLISAAYANQSIDLPAAPSGLRIDDDIELYFNIPPVAKAGRDRPASVNVSIIFNGSESKDLDGTIEEYSWDFGDGNIEKGEQVTHTYNNVGTYEVVLTVEDNEGLTGRDKVTIRVDPPGQPVAIADGPSIVGIGEKIQLDGTKSYDPDGKIERYDWWYKNKWHDDEGPNPVIRVGFLIPGEHEIRLKVHDNDGYISNTDTITIKVVSGKPPIADAGGPYSCYAGEEIILNGSKSYDSDGEIVRYDWCCFRQYEGYKWYNNTRPQFPFTFDIEVFENSYTLTTKLRVWDDRYNSNIDETEVKLYNPLQLSAYPNPVKLNENGLANVTLTASLKEDVGTPPFDYRFIIRNDDHQSIRSYKMYNSNSRIETWVIDDISEVGSYYAAVFLSDDDSSDFINVDLEINVVDGDPPNKPTIYGPTSGKAGEEYTYTASTTDPEGEDIYYKFDWGDQTDATWIGPYASGRWVSASHIWQTEGTYEIKVKAKNIHHLESDWSEPLEVKIEKKDNSDDLTGNEDLDNNEDSNLVGDSLLFSTFDTNTQTTSGGNTVINNAFLANVLNKMPSTFQRVIVSIINQVQSRKTINQDTPTVSPALEEDTAPSDLPVVIDAVETEIEIEVESTDNQKVIEETLTDFISQEEETESIDQKQISQEDSDIQDDSSGNQNYEDSINEENVVSDGDDSGIQEDSVIQDSLVDDSIIGEETVNDDSGIQENIAQGDSNIQDSPVDYSVNQETEAVNHDISSTRSILPGLSR